MTVPSSLFFNLMDEKFSSFRSLGNLFLRILTIALIMLLAFLPKDDSHILYIYLTVGSIGFCKGWPTAFTISTELKYRSHNNEEMYLATLTARVVYLLITILSLIACGHLMKIGNNFYI